MKRLNKWFFIFIGIFLISFAGSLYYIQTKSFSLFLTKVVREYLKRTQLEDVKFDQIRLSVLPPVLEIKNISVSYFDDGFYVDALLDKMEFNFIPKKIFSTQVSFGEMVLTRASIALRGNKKESKKPREEITLKKLVETLKKKAPIRFSSFLLKDTDVNYNEEYIAYIKELNFYRGLSDFEISLILQELKIRSFSSLVIEDIQLKTSITSGGIFLEKGQALFNKQKIQLLGTLENPFVLRKQKFNFKLLGEIELKTLNLIPQIKEIGSFKGGALKFNGYLKKDRELRANIKFQGEKINSDYIISDHIEGEAFLENSHIKLRDILIKKDEGRVFRKEPFSLYSLKSKEFLEKTIKAQAEFFPLYSALSYIRDITHPLRGHISGEVYFSLYSSRHFKFRAGKKTRIEKLKLEVPTGKKQKLKLLSLDWLDISEMIFVLKDSVFSMEGEGKTSRGKFQVHGQVGEKGLNFQVPQARIVLEDFGKIADFSFGGEGVFDIKIQGHPKDEIIFFLDGEGKNFLFEGNELGHAKIGLQYLFNKNRLFINRGDGQVDGYQYEFTGDIKIKEESLNLSFKTKDMSFFGGKKLTKNLVFSKIPMSLDFITGRAEGEVKIFGSFEDIKIDGNFKDGDFWIGSEYLRDIEVVFTKRGNTLSIVKSQGEISQGKVKIQGDYILGESLFDNFYIDIDKINMPQLNLFSSPNFRFLADLSGKMKLFKKDRKQMGEFRLNMTEVSTPLKKFPDGFLKGKIASDSLSFQLDTIGLLKGRGKLFFSEKGLSNFSFKVKTSKIAEYFSFLNINSNLMGLKGVADFHMDASFRGMNIDHITLVAKLNEFLIEKNDLHLKTLSKGDVFIIEKGEIKRAQVDLKGNGSDIKIRGKGRVGHKFRLSNKGRLNAQFFEVFVDKWLKSDGEILWDLAISRESSREKILHRGSIRSRDWKVRFVEFPISFQELNFELDILNKDLLIRDFHLKTPKGFVDIKGAVIWNGFYPKVDLTGVFEGVQFSLASDSFLNLSGNFNLGGDEFPYLLDGKVQVLEGYLRDGLMSKILAQESKADFSSPYFPSFSLENKVEYINLDIELENKAPVYLKNVWLDIPFDIRLRAEGGIFSPRLDGQITAQKNRGKLNFKDNTYFLKTAFIGFSPSEDYTNPSLNVEAESSISDYAINTRVIGSLKNYSVLLSSSPGLPAEDILSLITFGYVKNSSEKISQKSQEDMTSIGVGSILLDQLKVREILKDNLGLILSVQSKALETEESFLDSKTGAGGSIVDGKTQTTTRVQLKKRLSKKLEMTMEKDLSNDYQGLNLLYHIKNDISLKGIIEQKNNFQLGSGESDNMSVGADINLSWTFK